MRYQAAANTAKFRYEIGNSLHGGLTMKRAISALGGLALSTLFITAPLSIASAADMAVKAPPPALAPVPAYSWTGCYIGGNTGGTWAKSDDVDVSIVGGSSGFADRLLASSAGVRSDVITKAALGLLAFAAYSTPPLSVPAIFRRLMQL